MLMTASDHENYVAIRQQADAWWTQLRSDKLTRAEADAFRRWYDRSPEHERAWREVMHVWKGMAPILTEAVRNDPSLAYPARGALVAHRPSRRVFIGGAVAASAAAFLAVRPPLHLWPSVMEFAADYRTGTGEQLEVALSDRVTMLLNTQTRINRRTDEAGEGVELMAGEAEILTRATLDGRLPFAVYAAGAWLQAQSARFNIRNTGAQVCVSCLDGEIDIDCAGQRQSLGPGRQLIYDAQGLRTMGAVEPAGVSAWRTGSLSFVGQPLSEVVDEINRYRRGRVILRNAELARTVVRMRFSIHQTDMAIAMIRDLYGAQVTRLPGGVVLLG